MTCIDCSPLGCPSGCYRILTSRAVELLNHLPVQVLEAEATVTKPPFRRLRNNVFLLRFPAQPRVNAAAYEKHLQTINTPSNCPKGTATILRKPRPSCFYARIPEPSTGSLLLDARRRGAAAATFNTAAYPALCPLKLVLCSRIYVFSVVIKSSSA